MNSQQKQLLPLALGTLGGVAGSIVGYKESGAYWTWPRFAYSAMGSGLGIALGYTATTLIPTKDATTVSGLGAAVEAVSDAMLLPAIAPNDEVDTPLKLRRIEVVRGDLPIPNSPTLKIVALSTKQRARRANKDLPGIIQKIDRRYRTSIQSSAQLHNVPFEVIINKISIENPDLLDKVVTGGGATGIMQITPGTATQVLREEYRKNQLTQAEAAYFRGKLGTRFNKIVAGQGSLTTLDLKQADLNIHVGTLAIGQMIRKYTNTTTGVVSLHKAVAEYNRGGRAEKANIQTATPDQLIAYKNGVYSTPAVTQQYIMMYCGPGGGLDLLTRNQLTAYNEAKTSGTVTIQS